MSSFAWIAIAGKPRDGVGAEPPVPIKVICIINISDELEDVEFKRDLESRGLDFAFVVPRFGLRIY